MKKYKNEIFIIIATVVCLLLCASIPASASNSEGVTITAIHENAWSSNIYEIVDNETGVCYMWVSGGYKGGLSPMYNADGTLKVKR